MKRKTMTKNQAEEIGIKQGEFIVASLLFDKFDMSITKINNMNEYIGRLSDDLNNKTATIWQYADWAEEHDLLIAFSENTSFTTPEMRMRIDEKIRFKKTTIMLAMYALHKYMRFTYKDLAKLKSYVEDLQDSIDRKFLSYEDVYKEQLERGFVPWK